MVQVFLKQHLTNVVFDSNIVDKGWFSLYLHSFAGFFYATIVLECQELFLIYHLGPLVLIDHSSPLDGWILETSMPFKLD